MGKVGKNNCKYATLQPDIPVRSMRPNTKHFLFAYHIIKKSNFGRMWLEFGLGYLLASVKTKHLPPFSDKL